jgi:hypothetical protein
MSTCGKCKYWENEDVLPTPRFARGTAEPIVVGECDLISTITGATLFDSGHGMDISVTADDDSGLWSTLKTGENFGCINFQPKRSAT